MKICSRIGTTTRACRAWRISSIFLTYSLLILPSPGNAQGAGAKPLAQSDAAPTLESLSHTALPHSLFKAWCGEKGRFLLDVNGQLEAYDDGVKSATIAVSSSAPVQCGLDGHQLVYVDTGMGYITKVDIGSGASRLLATYKPDERTGSGPVMSPDFKSVASDRVLQLAAEVRKLKVVRVDPRDEVHQIKWSEDSSKLFVAYFAAIEVFDATGRKIGSGRLPEGSYYQDGWFAADQQALILFLGVKKKKFRDTVIKCRIADWTCVRLRSRVDDVSVGGRGIIGTVSPLGKPPALGEEDDDSPIAFDKYSVELRDGAARLLAQQTFLTANGTSGYEITVAPSGMKAILTWRANRAADCGTSAGTSSGCLQGMLIDLSKVLK
ncbi:hypothetical protein [Bradyrhizobium sp. Tv2a-2]|uniref:hypothetical protein n=1 Tax=Bradyrhizobium sp. Tv2a-2 TaxID=113395 RepID=UPI0004059CE2|nr:hypothetical protein [Bradyrhizobium sp. Tv2a-2]